MPEQEQETKTVMCLVCGKTREVPESSSAVCTDNNGHAASAMADVPAE